MVYTLSDKCTFRPKQRGEKHITVKEGFNYVVYLQ